jgi:uncharacterized protein (DUF885 family)
MKQLIPFVFALNLHAASPTDGFLKTANQLLDQKGKVAEAKRLHTLFAADWKYSMAEFPESATWRGVAGQNHRWTDYSLESVAARKQVTRTALAVLKSIDRAKLTPADQLNFDLFLRGQSVADAGNKFPSHLLLISQMDGIQRSVASMLRMMPARKAADYEDILARLRGTEKLVAQTIDLLNVGLKMRITPPKICLRNLGEQVAKQLTAKPLDSPLLQTFRDFPTSVSEADQTRLRAEAIAVYKKHTAPAFRRLHKFLVERYIPNCRESIACGALPNGKAWYQHRIYSSTTTDLTPKQIHAIGLSEVKRIRAEMEKIKTQTGFKGSLAEFFKFLRTDKQFYYERGTQLLAGYRDISKRADPELIKLFGNLPRQPYGIRPVPSYIERSVTTAYYQPGSTTAARPGYFYANTYNLAVRPKWEMEALTLHEAVPGHHLQLAIADELTGLPTFRKYARYTAYVEGWALYAESLGTEMGFYKDPYSKFGQLTYEMWRAIRLVVDTGMHALGWSRQRTIDYFKANAGKTEHDIIVEVDRYIVWPGQALAYKMGELKIKSLRARAEKVLGDKFDIRGFHDELLRHGAIPLSILETQVEAWITRQAAK